MNIINRIVYLALLLSLSACSTVPSSCTPLTNSHLTVQGALASHLDKTLSTAYQAGIFEGSTIIAEKGHIILRRGYGCADQATQQANAADMISDIGSVAKTFTASAILKLQTQGKLNLNQPLTEFFDNVPADKAHITIYQLLTHTSGLENFHNDSDFDVMSRSEAETRILALPLRFLPGEAQAYSNAGYTLLAAIVERVSTIPFQHYVRQHLLLPAGLHHTGWYQDEHIALLPFAKGYGGEHAGQLTFNKPLTWALIGAGGMVSSADDLFRWYQALSTAQLFTAEQQQLLFTKAETGHWTAGSWAVRTIQAQDVIEMGGSTDFGYTAKIQYLPAQDIVIILVFNRYSEHYGTGTHHAVSNNILLPAIQHITGQNH